MYEGMELTFNQENQALYVPRCWWHCLLNSYLTTPVKCTLHSSINPSIEPFNVHTNFRLIYKQKEEWLKGKTKMWDVFFDDMGLNNNVELALANLDLNELVLEPVTFDDGDPLEGSSSRVHINKCMDCIGYKGGEGGGGGWRRE
jgi:hypothetical protein